MRFGSSLDLHLIICVDAMTASSAGMLMFGCPATGVHIGTGDEVAIKLESVRSKHPQLLYESKVLRYLKGGVGLPEGRIAQFVLTGCCDSPGQTTDTISAMQCCGMASKETTT